MGLSTLFSRSHRQAEGSTSTPTEDVTPVKDPVASVPSDKAIGESQTPVSADPIADEKGNWTDETAAIEQESHENPEIAALPLEVRQLVSLTDDPTLPTITFRYFLLCVIFVIPGAFLSQMSYFRTTQAPYSIFFVQIACHYLGHFLARVLPATVVRVPFTKWSFSLNPGPWSIKEHVLVTVTAASGATYNLGFYPISLAELYYGEKVHPAVAIFFMFSIVWIGYSFAAIARQLLLYDPNYIWPQALMQSTLFETFRKTDMSSPLARKQMKVFFLCLIGMTLWQFLPEYVFPFTSSLAFLCWVAPHNPVANFIGSGLGGMGFLNLSLDWSNINWNGSSILLTPWWTQVILFLAFAVNCWILLPAAKWGNLGSYHHGLMSNKLLLANGSTYPVLEVLTPDFQINETAYQHARLAEEAGAQQGREHQPPVPRSAERAAAELQGGAVVVVRSALPGGIRGAGDGHRVRVSVDSDLDAVRGAEHGGRRRDPDGLAVRHLELPGRDRLVQRADVRVHGAHQGRERLPPSVRAVDVRRHRGGCLVPGAVHAAGPEDRALHAHSAAGDLLLADLRDGAGGAGELRGRAVGAQHQVRLPVGGEAGSSQPVDGTADPVVQHDGRAVRGDRAAAAVLAAAVRAAAVVVPGGRGGTSTVVSSTPGVPPVAGRPVERNNLLFGAGGVLRQHQHGVHVGDHRGVRGDVPLLPEAVRGVEAVQLLDRGGVRRWLQLQYAADLFVLWGGQADCDAELVGE
ncbi:Sexual differentiation process protein ISP4 [Rasamsonia emersonii CBS 393.64]|uniref:Sexual differentiation process protein ISP4 n=1 Tax=Rasamsonia emersonii (strain ATCC 16479 / CBS 393.64 / IMI 116815) TaxID=1408163 RepID=A0A0F4YIB6_RASE3|nr:Sexual differentiation process protein ISP4 [Rasamsonia emersonii CBS 393.64]KKA17860.1 Sexual differentiation process protein ISP4 [Rasamsonia emersonii CBS 393.64]